MKIEHKYIDTLSSFLGQYKGSYFLIGGYAAALNMEKYKGEFRATKDFDIVLVSKYDNSDFSNQLAKMIMTGGYENKYTNSKKNAYRFENPKSNNFPKIIEFFVEEGIHPQSLDNKLAKLEIEVNDEKLSAIVLNKEIYSFAVKHITIIDNIPVLDIYALIVLKTFAYFENKKLYDKKLIDREDYLKHRHDVFRLIMLLDTKAAIVNDVPPILLDAIRQFLPVLESCVDLAKVDHLDIKIVIDTYRAVFAV